MSPAARPTAPALCPLSTRRRTRPVPFTPGPTSAVSSPTSSRQSVSSIPETRTAANVSPNVGSRIDAARFAISSAAPCRQERLDDLFSDARGAPPNSFATVVTALSVGGRIAKTGADGSTRAAAAARPSEAAAGYARANAAAAAWPSRGRWTRAVAARGGGASGAAATTAVGHARAGEVRVDERGSRTADAPTTASLHLIIAQRTAGTKSRGARDFWRQPRRAPPS